MGQFSDNESSPCDTRVGMRQSNSYSAIGWAVRVSVTVRSSVRYGEWELELKLALWSEEYFVGWGKS